MFKEDWVSRHLADTNLVSENQPFKTLNFLTMHTNILDNKALKLSIQNPQFSCHFIIRPRALSHCSQWKDWHYLSSSGLSWQSIHVIILIFTQFFYIRANLLQSCLTLYNTMECGPPSSSVNGIYHTRILEWVAVSFFRGSSQPRDRTGISYVSCKSRQVLHHLCYWWSSFYICGLLIMWGLGFPWWLRR